MLRFVKAIFILPIAALLVLFAVANRQPVTLLLDPLGGELGGWKITVPLFAFFFITLAVGIVIGSITSWLAQGRHRRAERQLKRECGRLESENARLKAEKAPATGVLALRG